MAVVRESASQMSITGLALTLLQWPRTLPYLGSRCSSEKRPARWLAFESVPMSRTTSSFAFELFLRAAPRKVPPSESGGPEARGTTK